MRICLETHEKRRVVQCDEDCGSTFDSIKEYFTKLPVLASPVKGNPLVLYTTTLELFLCAMLAQQNADGKENALYYLSQTLVGPEMQYSFIEKVCLLIFAIKNLRHHLEHYHIQVDLKSGSLRYILNRQTLADFLVAHPNPNDSPLSTHLSYEEVMLVVT